MAKNEDVVLELEELKQFQSIAKSPRVVSLLSAEICNLEKLSNEFASAQTTAPISMGNNPNPISTVPKASPNPVLNYSTLSSFSWDQDNDQLKIYISLEGVKQEKIEADFELASFNLKFHEVQGKNYHFAVPKLNKEIVPEKCKLIVKPKMVVVTLVKASKGNWLELYFKEDELKPSLDEEQDPMVGIMDLMKNTNERRLVKSTWNVKEDVALMSSWIFVSKNKEHGRFQKIGSFWGKTHKMYEEARREDPKEINERNIESLKGRFNRLNKNAQKWIAANIEAHRRIRSGMSQHDLETEAHQLYDGKFTDLHVFNEVMRKVPKWEIKFDQGSRSRAYDEDGNGESGGSTKRIRTSEDGQHFSPTKVETPVETPESGGSVISRPTGIAQMKKNKENVEAIESSSEVVAEIRALRLTRDSEVQVINTLGRENVEVEKMKMKHSILMALLAKDHLSQKEEEMKCHLLALFK